MQNLISDSTLLTKKLISFPSITPETGDSLDFMAELLREIGFNVVMKKFDDIDTSSKPTWNIYAYTKKSPSRNLTFIGHLDVVHSGHHTDWTYPPFEPTVDNGILYGRGACDMKAAIACFCVASAGFVKANHDCGISMLLTYDEEGNAINGTKKMLQFLRNEGFTFSDAITGEPTCSKELGDTIKIGRRGSVNFTIEIIGKQGHAAYPEFAKNPNYTACKTILALKNYEFDHGNKNFQATNLEITGIETSTKETNVIPNTVKILCNVRFNDEHTSQIIIAKIKEIVETNVRDCVFKIETKVSGESFSLKSDALAEMMKIAVKKVTGVDAEFSTSGGTSDARFMKDYANIVEFGVLNKTAHKIDEHVPISHIEGLTAVYREFIGSFVV
jgi:succinyl-diaminopimelate desuccinylase